MSCRGKSVFALVAFLFLLSTAFMAHSSPAAAAEEKEKTDSRLETLLQGWKKADHEVRELHSTFWLTTEDPVLRDKETIQGEVFFKKPDLLRIDLKNKKGELSQILVYKGKTIRLYDFKNQNEVVIDPDVKPDWLAKWMSSFLKFTRLLYTLPFDETEKSFDFELNKEDEYWAYLQLKPLDRQALCYVEKFELALNQKTHLVRQIRYSMPNGTRMILDFEKVEINSTPPITWESISKDLPQWGKGSNQTK